MNKSQALFNSVFVSSAVSAVLKVQDFSHFASTLTVHKL